MHLLHRFRANYLRAKLRNLESRQLQYTHAYVRAMQGLMDAELQIERSARRGDGRSRSAAH